MHGCSVYVATTATAPQRRCRKCFMTDAANCWKLLLHQVTGDAFVAANESQLWVEHAPVDMTYFAAMRHMLC